MASKPNKATANKPTAKAKPMPKSTVKPKVVPKMSAKSKVPAVKSVAKVKPTGKPKSAAKSLSKAPSKAARKGSASPVRRKQSDTAVAVFIDLDNTNASRDNLMELLSILDTKGDISYGKIYGYTDDKVDEFEEIIAERRFETTGRMRFKNDASVVDTRLVVDCIGLTEQNGFDLVFVWAGVGDLIPLFTKIREGGSKTLTVDLPDFDCNNKFVDQKIKLYSPHMSLNDGTRRSVYTPVRESAPARGGNDSARSANSINSTNTNDIIFSGGKPPALPRKKGAPEFGAREEAYAPEEDEEISAAENQRLFEMTMQMLRENQERMEEQERKKRDYTADFGNLDTTSTADTISNTSAANDYDDNFGSLSPTPNSNPAADAEVAEEVVAENISSEPPAPTEAEEVAAGSTAEPIIEEPKPEPKKQEQPIEPSTPELPKKSSKKSADAFDDFGDLASIPTGTGADEKYAYEVEEDAEPQTESESVGEAYEKGTNEFNAPSEDGGNK